MQTFLSVLRKKTQVDPRSSIFLLVSYVAFERAITLGKRSLGDSGSWAGLEGGTSVGD